jgi:hypothetical protein
MEYKIPGLGKGAFEVIPEDDEVEFVAELGIGSDIPMVGPLVDAVLRTLFSRRLDAMKEHMQEEGQNLKRIMESGWRPESLTDSSINST